MVYGGDKSINITLSNDGVFLIQFQEVVENPDQNQAGMSPRMSPGMPYQMSRPAIYTARDKNELLTKISEIIDRI